MIPFEFVPTKDEYVPPPNNGIYGGTQVGPKADLPLELEKRFAKSDIGLPYVVSNRDFLGNSERINSIAQASKKDGASVKKIGNITAIYI